MDFLLLDIIFYKNIPEFLSWVQRVVTRTIYSHVSMFAGLFGIIGRFTEFDADLKVRLHSFEYRSERMDVLRILHVPHAIRLKIIRQLVEAYEGRSYGYIQWLTIFIRTVFERLGFKNAKKWDILWGWGVVCSELIYYLLMDVCDYMTAKGDTRTIRLAFHNLRDHLQDYNPNTFTPQDIKNISPYHPNCLRWV